MARLVLVMIARDEADVIARALESARAHVDAMIVLDTGSTDATRQIALAGGARVETFVWCDDFAAARNAALAHADGDWNLVLDADEWIAEGADALGPAALPPGDGGFLGDVKVASRIEMAGVESTGQVWIPRVLPRGVRYEGRIHEQPVSALPRRRLPLTFGHDGYLPQHLARKGDRNEVLLKRELEAAPHDAYLWFQLAKEYQARERPGEAANCFTEALRLGPPDAGYRHPLVVRTLMALKASGRVGEALTLADAEVANWLNSPDFYFTIGDLYLEAASLEPARALDHYLPVVELAWKRCLEIGERPDLEGAVVGRGGYMAAHNLAVFYETLGHEAQAQEYRALAVKLQS